jgi:hypothetical protein
MNRLLSILFFIIIFVGLGMITISLLNQLACEGQPINNNVSPTQSQQIWGDQIISQSFVAPRSYLNRVDILFQTYGRQNTHDVTFRVLEARADDENPLAGIELIKRTFNAASINDQSWYTFSFPPVADSAGKTYVISLQSPESEEGDAITVGGIERNVYVPGTAFLGPIPVPADITFRACFQMGIAEKLRVLSEQVTRNRPGLWNEITFYASILAAYVVLIVGFFWHVGRLPWR